LICLKYFWYTQNVLRVYLKCAQSTLELLKARAQYLMRLGYLIWVNVLIQLTAAQTTLSTHNLLLMQLTLNYFIKIMVAG